MSRRNVNPEGEAHNKSLMERGRDLLHKRSVAAGVAVAVGAGALAGCDANAEEGPQPTKTVTVTATPTETSIEPTTEPSPTDVPSDSETETENPGTQEIYEQTVSVEQMDAMSIEEFAQLPYADRAAYAYLKVPTTPVGTVDEDFNPEAVVGRYWRTIRVNAVGSPDTTEGAKIISALAYYTTDQLTGDINDSYMASADSILRIGGAGVGPSDSMAYVGHGTTQVGEDREGNPIEFTNISYFIQSEQTGEEVAPVRTSQVFQIPIQLEDGSVVVFYPMGYTIDGEQSPVEGYPY